MKRVTFTNFWPGFQPNNNFFIDFLNRQEEKWIVSSDKPDLEICSVFPSRISALKDKFTKIIRTDSPVPQALANVTSSLPLRKAPRRVWFTGENVRVPLEEDFDFSLSFDQDPYGGKNYYFPLWHTLMDWSGSLSWSDRAGGSISVEQLQNKRKFIPERESLAVAFIGNPHPVRFRAISELQKYGVVNVYGKSVGRPVASKFDYAKHSQFSICFENDLFPGYVTEKLIEAYITQTIPLYWGDLGADSPFNPKAFINLKDFESIEHFSRYVGNLSLDEIEDLGSQPLLEKPPGFAPLCEVFGC